MSTVRSLEVRLGDLRIGYLTHYPDEKTLFVVSEDFIDLGPSRPILTLSMARPGEEAQTRALLRDERHKSASVKAPPFFSNLLPEGGLRARIAQRLKVHEDREFLLLSALGHDLPGAVVLVPTDTPDHLRMKYGLPVSPAADELAELKFSLGGMQMKFSMLRQGERYTLNTGGSLGNYIVKPPSGDFEALPQVEAATMETARAVGVDVPEVALLLPEQIDGLPDMTGYGRGEPFYAIRRFDRPDDGRTHVEDFAQVFNLRPTQKYGRVNYDMIALTSRIGPSSTMIRRVRAWPQPTTWCPRWPTLPVTPRSRSTWRASNALTRSVWTPLPPCSPGSGCTTRYVTTCWKKSASRLTVCGPHGKPTLPRLTCPNT
jgi:serine/threonine-protein kinase HipA